MIAESTGLAQVEELVASAGTEDNAFKIQPLNRLLWSLSLRLLL